MKSNLIFILSLVIFITSCNKVKKVRELGEVTQQNFNIPVLINKTDNNLLKIKVTSQKDYNNITGFKFNVDENGQKIISNISVLSIAEKNEQQFGSSKELKSKTVVRGKAKYIKGDNNFIVKVDLKPNSNILDKFVVYCSSVFIDNKEYILPEPQKLTEVRLGIGLRQHNDDNVDTYRIPGLATTNNGTLIAVYDIRYNSSVDLQEDINIGMNRSIDGGQTWEPMKVIMDMKEWGGLPENQNGIGDPSVLVDRANNTIWVAAVWAHGHPEKRNWWASKPGLTPEKTSQFMLVNSTDDGVSWSEPINITKQVKKSEWYLMLQGPGKGITLNDGTLVFPAQFKDKKQMPHSTIIWSKNHGKSWTAGTGAKENTTEAQLIELDNGNLMLNMRDNRNSQDTTITNGRSVYVTDNLGKSWTKHQTSRTNVLKESTCQASLIKEEFIVDGKKQKMVLFSNPNTKQGRHHMTIKVSFDDGLTWPVKNQLLLDAGNGRGYSCLTKIDDNTVGILYEGSSADLIFQKVKIDDLIKKH